MIQYTKKRDLLAKANLQTQSLHSTKKYIKNIFPSQDRSITSGFSSILYILSKNIGFFHKPFVSLMPSYISYSPNFINNWIVHGNYFGYTDIISLYTKILQKEALSIIQEV